jgi:protein phosphatase
VKWTDRVFHHALTDVGLRRSHNQDAHGVVSGHLFVVADGMGAHAVGELASKLAVDSIGHLYTKYSAGEPLEALERSITEANQAIHEKGRQNREFEGMGTTATALLLMPRGACVGHVGDSRCYRIRTDRIEQLSFDHSLQWELARRQKIRPDQVTGVPSNIIIRSLGPEPNVKVDINGPYPIEPGDRFVLCSDGLSGLVSDWEIWAAVRFLPPDESCRFLVNLANLRGGNDNITVLIAGVGSDDDGVEPAGVAALGQWARQKAAAVPAEWWCLISGFLASIAGFVLTVGGWRQNIYAYGLGLLLWTIGLGLMVFRRRRRESDRSREAPKTTPIFRSEECSLDDAIIEELGVVENSLRELATVEQWPIDWTQLNLRTESAGVSRSEGRLADAFRDYCRAVSVLAAGLPQRREKAEVLVPNWETRRRPRAVS